MTTTRLILCHPAPHVRFIPIPKNAGTSIISAMFRLKGSVERIHDTKPKFEYWAADDARPTFAVIRHPVARFVSVWYNKVYAPHRPDTALIKKWGMRPGMPLGEFLTAMEDAGVDNVDRHMAPQRSFLPDGFSKTVHLLDHDNLAAEWRAAGLEGLYKPLPSLNATKRDSLQLDEDQWRRIVNLYREDFELQRRLKAGRYTLTAEHLPDVLA